MCELFAEIARALFEGAVVVGVERVTSHFVMLPLRYRPCRRRGRPPRYVAEHHERSFVVHELRPDRYNRASATTRRRRVRAVRDPVSGQARRTSGVLSSKHGPPAPTSAAVPHDALSPLATLRPHGIGRYFIGAFLAFWLTGWAYGEVAALGLVGGGLGYILDVAPTDTNSFFSDLRCGSLLAGAGATLFMVWLTGWTIGGLTALRVLLRDSDAAPCLHLGRFLSQRLGSLQLNDSDVEPG